MITSSGTNEGAVGQFLGGETSAECAAGSQVYGGSQRAKDKVTVDKSYTPNLPTNIIPTNIA